MKEEDKVDLEIRKSIYRKPIKYKTWRDLLKLTKSTKERYLFYDKLYRHIETKFPNSLENIMDLACGFNPFSIIFMKKYPKHYVAIDIEDRVIEILEKERKNFEKKGVNLYVYKLDLIRELNKLEDIFKQFNLRFTIFFFKTITAFSRIDRKYFDKFFDLMKKNKEFINLIILSVSRFSLTGKRILDGDLKIMRNLERLNILYEIYEIPNEIFFFITSFQ